MVGLNVIFILLLYKKYLVEVKFVLVDFKKVELIFFNKIERYYLVKLLDIDEVIIIDIIKVIYMFNFFCIEMDVCYDLFKDVMVWNIKEYNVKFKVCKLNFNEGYCFFLYIVLVIDEFVDFIMIVGKEVEMFIV